MPPIIAIILYLGGLAMFWLYFRISTDEDGEVLTDEEHELLQLADETRRQRQIEEDHMMLDSWEIMLAIGIKSYSTGQSSDEDEDVFNEWAVVLCNIFISHERAASGLPPFPDLGRPHDWEHWEVARPLVKLFRDFCSCVIGKALRHDTPQVTSQDIYDAEADFRAKGYWGRDSMWPFSREGDGELPDGHLRGAESEGRIKGFRLRSLSCPAVMFREDFRVVGPCAGSRDGCLYRERMSKDHVVNLTMLDWWESGAEEMRTGVPR